MEGGLPTLETPRLRLRALCADDLVPLFGIYGDPAVMRYASDPVFPSVATVETMLASVQALFEAGESLEWAVVRKADDALIGTCGLHSFDAAGTAAEVGCMLARSAWGCGYMREALRALELHAVRALGLSELRADIDGPNERSLKLFRALGFDARGNGRYAKPLVRTDAGFRGR